MCVSAVFVVNLEDRRDAEELANLLRWSWAECQSVLADIGLLLEYAAIMRGAGPDCYQARCMLHVADVAQRRLGLFCNLGWAALTAKACPFIALRRHSCAHKGAKRVWVHLQMAIR